MKKITKILISIILVIILGCFIFYKFFYNNTAKNLQIGNNSSSQEIVDYILNVSSYEAVVHVEVQSNKNTNKYILKQQYLEPNISVQEVIEPTNISGVKITRNGNQLKIENAKLNLSTIFNEYQYLSDNVLDLNTFIEAYKTNSDSKYQEKENEIVMTAKIRKSDRDIKEESLYINRESVLPTRMEIKDTNKNTNIYILYNEVSINSLKKENVLAFEINGIKKQI